MAFVVLGVILTLMRWLEVGPVAQWSWWIVLLPFAVAVAWWTWSDATGLTKRREMDKLDQRKAERRARQVESLGHGAAGKPRRGGRRR